MTPPSETPRNAKIIFLTVSVVCLYSTYFIVLLLTNSSNL